MAFDWQIYVGTSNLVCRLIIMASAVVDMRHYLRQGGYVFVVVCLFVCLQLCAKTSERICMKFSGKFGNRASEQMTKFCRRSGSRIRIQIWIRICIETLVRRALTEVCTVPVLLV